MEICLKKGYMIFYVPKIHYISYKTTNLDFIGFLNMKKSDYEQDMLLSV